MTPTPETAASGSNVHALPSAKKKITRDRLTFQTPEEAMVYDELHLQRRELPRYGSIALGSQVPASVLGHTFVLDLVVTSRGRSAAIEVDGAVHHGRWDHDRSRDSLLEDAGYAFIQRIDARDVHDAAALSTFVERLLFRLRERTAG